MFKNFNAPQALSLEDREKAEFLMETKHILEQIEEGSISMNEGYDKLMAYWR